MTIRRVDFLGAIGAAPIRDLGATTHAPIPVSRATRKEPRASLARQFICERNVSGKIAPEFRFWKLASDGPIVGDSRDPVRRAAND